MSPQIGLRFFSRAHFGSILRQRSDGGPEGLHFRRGLRYFKPLVPTPENLEGAVS